MTGTGTQTDPYIVDNWADFMSINRSQSGIYVRWADSDNKIIDFNDIQPEGYTSSITIPNTDFNGWTLRNFHSTAGTGMTGSNIVDIKNLILENFYISNINSNSLFYKTNINNSIISGIAESGGDCRLIGGNLTNSAINIKSMVVESFTIVFERSDIKNSDIVLDVTGKAVRYIDNLYYGSILNSRISGKISSSSQVAIGYSDSGLNVINLESNQPLYYAGKVISVYNSDLADKSSNGLSTLKACTTEQLKNAEYLYSIGFPIGID